MSEQQKTHHSEQMKQRFEKYSGSPNRVAVSKAGWKRFFLILLVLVMGAMLLSVNDTAPLTITGFAEASRHVVVRLDT